MTVAQTENLEKSEWPLEQWLAWLEQAHPKNIDLGLDRIRIVAKRLNLLKPNAKVITVAGTNGKGSCVATLEALLLHSDKQVGAYTSPHMMRYNERIKVNGEEQSDAAICRAFNTVEQARQDVSLTYFEFGTLAALVLFEEANLDYWVLEVGLGGRLDAVNVIDTDLAIITSIDLDHESWLGNTREKISEEKLGILRHGIPCVCAERQLTETMRAMFRAMDSDLKLIGREYDVTINDEKSSSSVSRYLFSAKECVFSFAENGLSPFSIGAAIQALNVLGEINLENRDKEQVKDISRCIDDVFLSGRKELVIKDEKQFVLDVAHNPASTALLSKRLEQDAFIADVAVVGMMADKNISDALSNIKAHVKRWFVCDISDTSRAESKENLCEALVEIGVKRENVTAFDNVSSAINAVTGEQSKVLVFGSFHIVGDARKSLSLN